MLGLGHHLHEEEDHLARNIATDPVDIHIAPPCHPVPYCISQVSCLLGGTVEADQGSNARICSCSAVLLMINDASTERAPHIYELDVVEIAVSDGLVHLLVLPYSVLEVLQCLQHRISLQNSIKASSRPPMQ